MALTFRLISLFVNGALLAATFPESDQNKIQFLLLIIHSIDIVSAKLQLRQTGARRGNCRNDQVLLAHYPWNWTAGCGHYSGQLDSD